MRSHLLPIDRGYHEHLPCHRRVHSRCDTGASGDEKHMLLELSALTELGEKLSLIAGMGSHALPVEQGWLAGPGIYADVLCVRSGHWGMKGILRLTAHIRRHFYSLYQDADEGVYSRLEARIDLCAFCCKIRVTSSNPEVSDGMM